MTSELHPIGDSAKTWTIIVWALLLLGPAAFFLSLLSGGVWLAGMGAGWWGVSEDPPSDYAVFGPIVAVILAEIIGGLLAYGAIVVHVRRGGCAGAPFESHANSAIRTFWVMAAGFAGAMCLAFSLMALPNIDAVGFSVGAMFILLLTLPLLFIWKTMRVVRGLRRAIDGRAFVDDPTR